MKNAALILNAILLVLVGVLFYLHFSSHKDDSRVQNVQPQQQHNSGFKIGYFEWDSVIAHFDLFKEMQNEYNAKDESNAKRKMQMRQEYQNMINKYSQRELSQVESEMATKEIKKKEQEITNEMQTLDAGLQELQFRKTNEVNSKIETFLKEYNKTKGYSFVLAYEPNFIFYRDTSYNITNDLIRGLNAQFPKKK
ncbi:MAG: OmpH family outer membrane protein [Flavisolibacter sp.]|jgi:outer membrane protein